jgi:heterodisulfide reductase subunit B
MDKIRIPRMPSKAIFEPPRVIGRILADDDFSYITEPPVGMKAGDILLHVSCQTLTVSHIPFLAQKIMEKIGLDFSTVGGPENCCGAFQWHMGDEEYERQMATMALGGFRRMKPVRVVSTCPDCDTSFKRHMARQHTYKLTNIAELFAEHIDELKALMTAPVKRKVVIHWHEEGEPSDAAEIAEARGRDAHSIRLLMESIPGLEILEASKAKGVYGHCAKVLGSVRDDVTHAMFTEAKELGADCLVVPYHGCYRNHCKQQLKYGIEVHHYLALIAQAMGVAFNEPFKELRMLDNIDQAMERLRPRIDRFGYQEDDVRAYLLRAVYS